MKWLSTKWLASCEKPNLALFFYLAFFKTCLMVVMRKDWRQWRHVEWGISPVHMYEVTGCFHIRSVWTEPSHWFFRLSAIALKFQREMVSVYFQVTHGMYSILVRRLRVARSQGNSQPNYIPKTAKHIWKNKKYIFFFLCSVWLS